MYHIYSIQRHWIVAKHNYISRLWVSRCHYLKQMLNKHLHMYLAIFKERVRERNMCPCIGSSTWKSTYLKIWGSVRNWLWKKNQFKVQVFIPKCPVHSVLGRGHLGVFQDPEGFPPGYKIWQFETTKMKCDVFAPRWCGSILQAIQATYDREN